MSNFCFDVNTWEIGLKNREDDVVNKSLFAKVVKIAKIADPTPGNKYCNLESMLLEVYTIIAEINSVITEVVKIESLVSFADDDDISEAVLLPLISAFITFCDEFEDIEEGNNFHSLLFGDVVHARNAK